MIRAFVHFIQRRLHIVVAANVKRRIGVITRFPLDFCLFVEFNEYWFVTLDSGIFVRVAVIWQIKF